MKSDISKARLKKVGSRERKSSAPSGQVAFRNGNALALLYAALFILAGALSMRWARPDALRADWEVGAPASVIILLVALLCARVLLGLFAPHLLARNSRILMLSTVSMFSILLTAGTIVATRLINTTGIHWDVSAAEPFCFPFLLAPALTTLLAGPAAGIAIGIGNTVAGTIFVRNGAVLPVMIMGLATSVVVAAAVSNVRRRLALLRVFLVGGMVQVLGVVVNLTLTLANGATPGDLVRMLAVNTLAVAASVVLAYAAVIILLPLHEHFFGACSNIRLNEFADLSHPLLERLSLEAPGTYHHCMVVASLAAAAAERIGANALLARVAAYYHDIGKITKPAYYTENTRGEPRSPHDAISPNMSAVIINAHVKEGIGLALHYNLPPPVRDVVREHHGTSVMTWFLHKAREEAKVRAEATGKPSGPVDESQFRYGGPRPTTRESGIILLADSVEAASRSLERTTRSAIENLVDNIVRGKIDDEQLDCCHLSFVDVATIKRTFITTLCNILHPRIAYPKGEEAKEIQNEADHRNAAGDPAD